MHIAVIAANGRSGQAFVEAALAAGHTIRAGILGRHHLQPHAKLEIKPCDATDPQQLAALLQGQEAVASFIGHVRGSAPRVQTEATRQILQAMRTAGITRIVSLTGTGVRFPGDHITFMDRLLNAAIGLIDPARVADGRAHVALLQASDAEWTVLRVLKLQDITPRPFMLREHGPTKLVVSRRDVARAALDVLEQHAFVRQAPILGADL